MKMASVVAYLVMALSMSALFNTVIEQGREIAALKDELGDLQLLVESVAENRKHKLTATAYSASVDETNSNPYETAIQTRPVEGRTVAVSRDLVHWLGHKVYIKGMGVYRVEDLMNARYKQRIDIFVGSKGKAKDFGKKTLEVVLIN